MLKNILIVFFPLLLVSVNLLAQQKNERKKKIDNNIPLNSKKLPVLKYRFISYEASLLGLDSLVLGYDSLQIRIWVDSSLKHRKKLIVLKKQKAIWLADFLILEFESIPNSIFEKPIVKEHKQIVFSSNWGEVIKAINNLSILSLLDQGKISGYAATGGADGITYTLEYATKSKYRFCSYWQPQVYQKKYWQAKKMMSFVLTILEALKKDEPQFFERFLQIKN